MLRLWQDISAFARCEIAFFVMVLSQDIITRPGTKSNRDIIQDKRLNKADIVINLRLLLDKMFEGSLIVKG